MELGVFSLSDIYPGSPDTAASRIDDIISYGVLAEQQGLDVFGIGEHHRRAFAVSSPAVVHAAIARATTRIKLTTTATVLSVLDTLPGHLRPRPAWRSIRCSLLDPSGLASLSQPARNHGQHEINRLAFFRYELGTVRAGRSAVFVLAWPFGRHG